MALRCLSLYLSVVLFFPPLRALASEVVPEGGSKVIVREHPKTGRPLVCITAGEHANPPVIFAHQTQKISSRPDYRMLQTNVKPEDVGYDGPVSSRKKVYAFAAVLVAGGVAGYALIPAAATTGAAAGGAGTYALAGGAVTAGTISGALAAGHADKPDDFTHKSQSVVGDSIEKGSESTT